MPSLNPTPGTRLRALLIGRLTTLQNPTHRRTHPTEPGFEIAQSMGIALLGLVVAAVFATALEGLGVDVIARIRSELGL